MSLTSRGGWKTLVRVAMRSTRHKSSSRSEAVAHRAPRNYGDVHARHATTTVTSRRASSSFSSSKSSAPSVNDRGEEEGIVSEGDKSDVPALVVFDLDACLWTQEMFQLRELVDRSNPVLGALDGGVGVIGARSGDSVIRLHDGALEALRQFYKAGHVTCLNIAGLFPKKSNPC